MKKYFILLAFLFHPVSAWAIANGDPQIVELESCNDKEITLVTDDPLSVNKILQLPRIRQADIEIKKNRRY
jgi:hypothetical protein